MPRNAGRQFRQHQFLATEYFAHALVLRRHHLRWPRHRGVVYDPPPARSTGSNKSSVTGSGGKSGSVDTGGFGGGKTGSSSSGSSSSGGKSGGSSSGGS